MKRLCILILVCTAFSGCNVYPVEIERAKKYCEPHGGLYMYEPMIIANTKEAWTGKCHCVDGTVIEERHSTINENKNLTTK